MTYGDDYDFIANNLKDDRVTKNGQKCAAIRLVTSHRFELREWSGSSPINERDRIKSSTNRCPNPADFASRKSRAFFISASAAARIRRFTSCPLDVDPAQILDDFCGRPHSHRPVFECGGSPLQFCKKFFAGNRTGAHIRGR